MIVGIKRAKLPHKETLANLLEKSQCELSQYDERPFDKNGLYGYENLDSYFNEETCSNYCAYLIFSAGQLAGFTLINKIPKCDMPCDWAIAEFYIAPPYRKKHVATRAMLEIFKHYTGVWQIKYNCNNTAGANFWNKVCYAGAKGKVATYSTRDFFNKSKGKVLLFET